MPPTTFAFAFDPTYRRLARPFGITERTSGVTVTDAEFAARFGPWRVRTPLSNITGTTATGPYRLPLTAGPAHLSFADRGLTFATNGREGLCIEFAEPIRGIDPFGLLKHPGLTVTVADCASLASALAAAR